MSQVNHSGCNGLGSCVGRLAAPETVSNGGSSLLLVSRQDAPGVARADTHECSRLIQRHVLSQQAVEDLESRLFFGRQSHILHKMNVTFLLGGVVIFTVIPAKAGIQRPLAANAYLPATGFWIPAFAGMTETDAWRPIFLN